MAKHKILDRVRAVQRREKDAVTVNMPSSHGDAFKTIGMLAGDAARSRAVNELLSAEVADALIELNGTMQALLERGTGSGFPVGDSDPADGADHVAYTADDIFIDEESGYVGLGDIRFVPEYDDDGELVAAIPERV